MSDKQQARFVQRAREPAQAAWKWVGEVENASMKVKEGYLTLARKLPSYLQVSGLGQTMAFLYAKGSESDGKRGERAEGMLYKQLDVYLRARLGRSERTAMDMIVNLTPADYRRATRDLMQVADWLKRFAEGRLSTGART